MRIAEFVIREHLKLHYTTEQYVEMQECQSQIFATATKQSRHLIRMKIINQQPALLKAHCLEKFVRPKKQTEEVCFRSLMIPTDTVVQGFSREGFRRGGGK